MTVLRTQEHARAFSDRKNGPLGKVRGPWPVAASPRPSLIFFTLFLSLFHELRLKMRGVHVWILCQPLSWPLGIVRRGPWLPRPRFSLLFFMNFDLKCEGLWIL